MAYHIQYSNSSKAFILVSDGTIDTSTSIGLAGYKSISYGETIATNFIHLLENFANDDPPTNPIEGQLWYKTVGDTKQLFIYNDSAWVPSSGLWKTNTAPINASDGDLWSDGINKILYIYSSGVWLQIGSTDSSTNDTGFVRDTIIDTTNATHEVLRLKINNDSIAIFAKDSFTPKSFERGFTSIYAGFNINHAKLLGLSRYSMEGIANHAKNLIIQTSSTEEIIPAINFIRSDTEALLNEKVTINTDDGILIGNTSTLAIKAINGHIYFENQLRGSHISFVLDEQNVLSLGNRDKIGINNIFPEYELDVNGAGRFIGEVVIENRTNSNSPSTGSIITHGGLGVLKDVNIKEDLNVYGKISTNSIKPLYPDSNIGTSSRKFNEVHANTFHGTFYGHLAGSSEIGVEVAKKLTEQTAFSLEGDIVSPNVLFDGDSGGLVKTFTTALNHNVIVSKPTVTILDEDDSFLLHSNLDDSYSTTSRLCRITRDDLVSNIINNTTIVPVGTITRFAGNYPPPRWLVCDGSQVNKSDYPLLEAAILDTFTPVGHGVLGKFHLPDLHDDTIDMKYIIYAGT